jgi:hypothetical protein
MSAVFWGMFWAVGMLLWETLSRSDKRIKPILSLENVLAWAFFGLFFGLGTTFRWKAFHWPLILFIIATFVGGGFFASLAKRKLSSEQ